MAVAAPWLVPRCAHPEIRYSGVVRKANLALGCSSSICGADRCYTFTIRRAIERESGSVERMTEMTPKGLARKITKLRPTLVIRGVWRSEGVWYKSQKEHWLGWLSEYDGPGAYDRKTRQGRSARFVYNHINCPPMLLWLAEAVGVPKGKVLAAKRSALATSKTRGGHCAAIRKAIPWQAIEEQIR